MRKITICMPASTPTPPSSCVDSELPAALRKDSFEPTQWTLVLKACQADTEGLTALNELCEIYRLPLYTFVRHRGISPADAEDIIQSFFQDFISRRAYQRADPCKGRFRSFLLAALKNFLANQWDRQNTIKRGGQFRFVPLDLEQNCGEFVESPLDSDKVYDRAWAKAILERVFFQLREDYKAKERYHIFEALESVLSKDGRSTSYSEVAQKLGMKEDGARMAASRLRRAFGQLLRKEVLRTIAKPEEADDELRYLLSCW